MAITAISVIDVLLNQERWKSKNVLDCDIGQYYSYLPASFYEGDLSLSFLNDTINQKTEQRYYTPNKAPNGNYVIKMTMGMALSYLPFFTIAHCYAVNGGAEADGFSEPYQFGVQFSSLFYFLIGLIFLNKILRHYFSERITLITIGCICFGTNVYYNLTIGAGMSHIFTFSLMAIFIYQTLLWYRLPTIKSALVLGLVGGLIVLVRPVNMLIVVIFILYDVKRFSDLKVRLTFLLENMRFVLLMISCAVLVCLPQLLYWKQVSGDYFFNSYIVEHFYFFNPHIFYGLFSFRKGWLIYTPMMAFALFGFYFLKEKLVTFKFMIPLFFLIYIYVVFSWWCWWYGGTFGQRPLIDIYPLLAIPMAAFFEHTNNLKKLKRTGIYILVVLFILLNFFQTIQAKYNIIHYDSMTRANYFEVFFSTSKKPDREKYLQHPDNEKALRGEEEY
jgi:hypothetical protein